MENLFPKNRIVDVFFSSIRCISIEINLLPFTSITMLLKLVSVDSCNGTMPGSK